MRLCIDSCSFAVYYTSVDEANTITPNTVAGTPVTETQWTYTMTSIAQPTIAIGDSTHTTFTAASVQPIALVTGSSS